MITITHEGPGPYIERTIIDYGGIRSHAEIPDAASFEAIVSNSDGESLDDLKERIEMLEGQLEEEKEAHQATRKDLKDAEEEIRDLNGRLDESDPAESMRQEIERLKADAEMWEHRCRDLSAKWSEAVDELNQARSDVRSLKAGIVPKVKRVRAMCACGGSIRNRRGDRPAACVVCGTPKGSTPDPETIARVKASH